MKKVAVAILGHIKETFRLNYENGNFDYNPEKEMFIRADYPVLEQDAGFRPAIVIKTIGGLTEEHLSIGDHNLVPQSRSVVPKYEGHDSIYTGQCVFRTISEVDEEASTLAWLTLLTINGGKKNIIGKEGIIDVQALGFTDATPVEVGSKVDVFACDLQVRYSKREAFATYKDGEILSGVNHRIRIR